MEAFNLNKSNKKIVLVVLSLLLILSVSLVVLFIVLRLNISTTKNTDKIKNNTEIESTTEIVSKIDETPTANDKQVEEQVVEADEELVPEVATQVDYLNSQESVEFQIVAQSFSKAYLSGDAESMKKYLGEVEGVEIFFRDVDNVTAYKENVYGDLEYMILKWNPEDLATKTKMSVQYQFVVEGTDSADYLGLEMAKVSNEWKVIDYYIEK